MWRVRCLPAFPWPPRAGLPPARPLFFLEAVLKTTGIYGRTPRPNATGSTAGPGFALTESLVVGT